MGAIQVLPVTVEQILPLRHRILRAGLPREAARLDGDDAPTTLHLAAVADEEIVACASVMRKSYQRQPAWQLRAMAVDPLWQSRGVGRMMLRAAQRRAAAAGDGIMWCNARVPATGFYEREGWRVVSEPFDVPDAGPHVRMIKQLRLDGNPS